MTYDPSTTWSTAISQSVHLPVYFMRIDGVGTVDFATGPVQGATVTKSTTMLPPRGGKTAFSLLDGRASYGDLEVEVLDKDDEVTSLIATEAPGATASTLINKTVTIYGGFRHLTEAEYPAIYTGPLRGLETNDELTGYVFRVGSQLLHLDTDIMVSASDSLTCSVRGNPVNLYYAILADDFSTGHATFPLDYVSSDGSTSSAPTGVGIATASINQTQLVTERDRWFRDDVVEVVYTRKTQALAHLQNELFRVFQSIPTVSPDGKIGLRFLMPALAPAQPETLTEADILSVQGWRRNYDEHLNKYEYSAETTKSSGTFDVELYASETAEDTADQSNSGETIVFDVDSQWLSANYDGAGIASTLAGRTRLRYLKTPATLELSISARKQDIEQGDIIAVTHHAVPNLRAGTRGLDGHLMLVTSVAPDYGSGVIDIELIDAGFTRYGVIAPSSTPDYAAASDVEKNSFVFISNASGTMANGDAGYRMI